MTSLAASRRAGGLRPLRYDRADDDRPCRAADHLAPDPVLLARRAMHRGDHRARVPEEGQRRPRQPARLVAVLRPDRKRARRAADGPRPGRARRSTTATSTPITSATSASRSQKLPEVSQAHPAGPGPPLAHLVLRADLHPRPPRANLRVAARRDLGGEPALYDAHMEEVRSGHSEEPERFHADPRGGVSAWDRSDHRARHPLPDGRAVDRLPRRVSVLGPRPGAPRRGGPLGPDRGRAGRRAAAARVSPA